MIYNDYEYFKSVVLKTSPDLEDDEIFYLFDKLANAGIRGNVAGTLIAKNTKKQNPSLCW